MQKVFVTGDNRATFTCPECELTRTVNVTQYKELDRAVKIKVKCPCGHDYPVILERRRQFRRQVNFKGTYYQMVDGRLTGKGQMVVSDVSRTGLGIRLSDNRELKTGDKLFVEFHLDDTKRSFIRTEVVIRKIVGFELGTEFFSIDPSDPNMKAIGFYLFG